MTKPRIVPSAVPNQWLPSEQEAWLSANSLGDILYDGGPASEWAVSTRERSERYYGSLVYFHDRLSGLPPAQRISDRLSDEVILGYLDYRLEDVSDSSLAMELRRIAAVVKLLDPVADRSVLLRASTRLAKRHRRKAQTDLQLLDPPTCLMKAFAVMDAQECGWNGLEVDAAKIAASQYTSALMVAFWTLCPLRPMNIAGMRRFVHFEGWGTGSRLSFAANEMKEKRPFSATFPSIIANRLQSYWDVYRAALVPLHDQHDYIWVDSVGRPLSPQGASAVVADFTAAHLGIRLTGHKLRHAAASFIAQQCPESVGLASGVLGHSNFAMTAKYYIKGQQHAAIRLYAQCVEEVIASAACRQST